MVVSQHPSSSHAAQAANRALGFVAADVGGTHVRIGLVSDAGGQIEVLAYRKYACADFPGLAEVFQAFLDELPDAGSIRHAVIASAGHALADGTLLTVNLPWPVSLATLRERLRLDDIRLVNDFEAVAHAMGHSGVREILHLAGPAIHPAGPSLVVGPGTGLGAAVRIPVRGRHVVLTTEAGQSALTATTEQEIAVLRYFLAQQPHVPVEHVLSGPGIVRTYRALGEIAGTAAPLTTPDAISHAASTGKDALARETLDLFCGLLGSTLGDMALLYGAHGGIHVAGGVLPQIRDVLVNSRFVPRFLDKGPMREALEHVPVKLVEHGQLGVIGAASWYIDQRNAQNDG